MSKTTEKEYKAYDAGQKTLEIHFKSIINAMIYEIKQDPTISISQRNYAIKKMEELKNTL